MRHILKRLALATMCIGGMSPAGAAPYNTLYNFKGGRDGYLPVSSLLNVNSILFGTTVEGGGSRPWGTVFGVTLSGIETTRHPFKRADGGYQPAAGLLRSGNDLYGTTTGGGTFGYGTVFKVTQDGIIHIIYSFKGTPDGDIPEAGLERVDDALYGTTEMGGANGLGAVFQITRAGAETVVHSFGSGTDGSYPLGGMVDVNGTLYGTLSEGGEGGYGVVYSVTPTGIEAVVHSFNGGSDGKSPFAGLLYLSGTLYGTTYYGGSVSNCGQLGCGTVFEVTPGGTETVLYSFKRGNDGRHPIAGVVNVGSKLYGTTVYGGASRLGTIYSVSKLGGVERVLHSFLPQTDGRYPHAGLLNVGGTLYGAAAEGGVNGYGTLFSVSP